MTASLIIVWRVTEACDLACPFCAYSRDLPHPRGHANPEQILTFGALLTNYAAQTSRDILISWLGGEPLRWPPLFEISRVFKHAYHFRLSATTNGTALGTERIRRAIAENFDELTISLDGLDSVHNDLRCAPGLFAQLRESIAALRDFHPRPRLCVNTLLLRDNIHTFAELCETLADWGIEQLTFNALGGRDRPEFYPDHCLLPEQLTRFRADLPALRVRLAPRGLAILGSDSYLDRLSASALSLPSPISDCSPGQQFLFIDEHGFISPCSFTSQGYGIHLSELCAPADLEYLPRLFAARQHSGRLAICDDCPSTQVFGKFSNLQFSNPHFPLNSR